MVVEERARGDRAYPCQRRRRGPKSSAVILPFLLSPLVFLLLTRLLSSVLGASKGESGLQLLNFSRLGGITVSNNQSQIPSDRSSSGRAMEKEGHSQACY